MKKSIIAITCGIILFNSLPSCAEQMLCGTPVKIVGLVYGVDLIHIKEYVQEGGRKLFPKSKTVSLYYGDDDCHEMFTNIIKDKSEMVVCVSFVNKKNDLGLEALGIRDPSILWIKRCAVPD